MTHSRLVWLLFGALSSVLVLFLLGATDVGPPNYGRYQVSSWSTSINKEKAVVGAFVIDTATGETKNVYTRIVNPDGTGRFLRNDLNTTFYSIK
jgi:hypothetical protein